MAHFDPVLETIVESDSSDYVSAGVISQRGADDILRPVAFFSKSLLPAECNYEIYDKELLAIVRCFEEWRPELMSVENPTKVLTDHRSLEYFMTTKKLNRRQARWAEFLADFDFKITYQAGKFHAKADALTRRPGDRPDGDDDDRQQHQHQTILGADKLDEEVKEDLGIQNVEVVGATTVSTDEKIYVAEKDRIKILREVHDQPASGHPGVRRTLAMLRRVFFWPKMRATVDQYVRNCHECQRAKAPREKYMGLLRPLPIPDRPWVDISLDFVTGLPASRGSNAVLMVVDRFSKMRHLIPCTTDEHGTTAEETARLLITHVWKLHGLPDSMVSDRGPQFIASVWQLICTMLKIKAKLSTAFHPETDGQSEIANQEMERYLRTYVNYQQDNWAEWLPMAEYAANACVSSSTEVSPFMINYGFEPRMSFDPPGEGVRAKTTRERVLKDKAVKIKKTMKDI